MLWFSSEQKELGFHLLCLIVSIVDLQQTALRKFTLNSSDGESFQVDEDVAMESQTIKHLIEDDCANNPVPLPNVMNSTMVKVIEYCKKHV
ncbi:hypothetical protein GIB67_004174 [Kingdonia uniflora]|uniref:SKP1 component POZ domain-containing protein n=1 Tax=Kingdonia uniflora TaxID=39325 RepID=A0A7J7LLV0_9MAGN|nr:hypothetical protein GIB67_004174 [Kingdonia uniflora]